MPDAHMCCTGSNERIQNSVMLYVNPEAAQRLTGRKHGLTMPQHFRFLACAFIAILLLSGRLQAQEARMNEATKALHKLFASEWDYWMEQYPTWASSLGDRRWNDRWEDLSLEAIEKDHQHRTRVPARLKAIDRRRLSPPDQLNYDLFRKDYAMAIEGDPYHWYLAPL